LTDYWTDFESESGFEKVLSLATVLVHIFIDQSYSLTKLFVNPSSANTHKIPSPDNRVSAWATHVYLAIKELGA
jgi:hypothetical protein